MDSAALARRRKVKAILVEEAGGCCRLCGYDRYTGALQAKPERLLARIEVVELRGVARSLERCGEAARKCMLLCANCHAEVEAGVAAVR